MPTKRNLFALFTLFLCCVTTACGGPTWEYKQLFSTRSIEEPKWKYFEDGAELPSDTKMTAKLNELGTKGWELVTVVPISSETSLQGGGGYTNTLTYWLKRSR